MRLLIEVLQFIDAPHLKETTRIFIQEFRKSFKQMSYTTFWGVTPQYLIDITLGTTFLDSLRKVLPKKILTKVSMGPRVLTYFADGICKNRYIALLDWLSQGTLAPLHHSIMYLLKHKFGKTDYTFDQGASIETLIKYSSEGRQA